jgi:hypothetical protein
MESGLQVGGADDERIALRSSGGFAAEKPPMKHIISRVRLAENDGVASRASQD